jgi:hypothetical protein
MDPAARFTPPFNHVIALMFSFLLTTFEARGRTNPQVDRMLIFELPKVRASGRKGELTRVSAAIGAGPLACRRRSSLVARCGAQERPAISWLILNRSGNTWLPADRGRSITRTRSCAIPAIRQMTSAGTL